MLCQFTLFGAMCLAICLPMVNADCGEEEKTCQKVVLELCGQTVRDACAKVDTLSCKDEICKGCGSVACQQVKKCRTEAEDCVEDCMYTEDYENVYDCIGVGRWSVVASNYGFLTSIILKFRFVDAMVSVVYHFQIDVKDIWTFIYFILQEHCKLFYNLKGNLSSVGILRF